MPYTVDFNTVSRGSLERMRASRSYWDEFGQRSA